MKVPGEGGGGIKPRETDNLQKENKCHRQVQRTGIQHCKPGEVYTRLKTAFSEGGPGKTHMCILEICMWSLLILEFTERCYFRNSMLDLLESFVH